MDTFFLNELRMCCADINNDKDNINAISRVIDAYKRVMSFVELARREGLIALEEACEDLNQNDIAQKFLFKGLMMIVDGTEPEIVSEMGMNRIAVNACHSYEGLIILMYHKAVLMMQQGDNPLVIGAYMQSLMPEFLEEILVRKMREKEQAVPEEKTDEGNKWVRSLCEDNKAIDERDYSIINQTALTLMQMSDGEIQRLLRETENSDVVTAMVELPGKARARLFDNMSTRLRKMVAEDVMKIGPVTFSDVEKACVTMMRKVIKLEAEGEIASRNLTVLKFVIGVYDMPNKKKK